MDEEAPWERKAKALFSGLTPLWWQLMGKQGPAGLLEENGESLGVTLIFHFLLKISSICTLVLRCLASLSEV